LSAGTHPGLQAQRKEALHTVLARQQIHGGSKGMVQEKGEIMRKGDLVKWTSQSGGFTKSKRGRIIAVVPAGMEPERFIPEGHKYRSSYGFGISRNHESYLVAVDGEGRGLYWPRVRHLTVFAELD